MEGKLLAIDKLNKNFGGLQAIKDLTIEVEEGAILGIIGPNGAGKTTLFNIISGQLIPESGHIYFKGVDLTKLKPHKRTRLGIARTFQKVRPFRNLSVYENILASFLNSDRETNEKVNESILKISEDIGLTDKLYVDSNLLTIGQMKRLEIARALASDPKLLLLDEPFAGSSMEEISEMIEVIFKVHEQGMTIIIIEHVLRALMKVVEKIIVLDRGKKIAEGNPEEIVNNKLVISVYIGKGVFNNA